MSTGDFFFINYSDTVTGTTLKSAAGQASEINVKASPSSLPVSLKELTARQDSRTVKPQVIRRNYNMTRERYMRWKEEQTLLIDSDRYVNPNANITLPLVSLKEKDIILPTRNFRSDSSDWFTLVICLSLLLVSLVNFSFRKYLHSIFRSTVNYPTSSRLFREQNISMASGAFYLDILFFLVIGLFGFQIMKYFGLFSALGGLSLFLIVSGTILSYFLLKSLTYLFLGFITETGKETGEYLFNIRNYNKVLGLALLPIVCLAAWAPVQNPSPFLFAGMALTAVFYLMTLHRGVLILLKKQFSVFYLFLYLCTLEFLPMLLFIKVIYPVSGDC